MAWQAARAVKIPVIGIGGIASAEDALEFLIAGCRAVQIGTANFVDPGRLRAHAGRARATICERHGLADIDAGGGHARLSGRCAAAEERKGERRATG